MWKLSKPTVFETKARAMELLQRLHDDTVTARGEVRYQAGRTRAKADVLVLVDGVPAVIVEVTKSAHRPLAVFRLEQRTGLPVVQVVGASLFGSTADIDDYLGAVRWLLDARRKKGVGGC